MSAASAALGLHVSGLRIGHKRALLDMALDLHVPRGTVVALLGANGAGKSTLLRSLAQVTRPLAGRVVIDGLDLTTAAPKARARLLALALTERADLRYHSAEAVVAMGRFAHTGWTGRLGHDDRAAVSAALARVGARHLALTDMSRLSDGEFQRVMIARALAQEPRVLLLDEPAAFLDLAAKAELWALLRDIARARDMVVVLSSHDPDCALQGADQLWLIDAAQRFHQGTPAALIAAGVIGRAFASPHLRFDPEQRRFDLDLRAEDTRL